MTVVFQLKAVGPTIQTVEFQILRIFVCDIEYVILEMHCHYLVACVTGLSRTK